MAPVEPTECDGITRHLQVHSGLEGFDEDLDTLISIYEELQLCSGDIANPELDLLTFASGAHYFGVLTEYEIHPPPKEDKKSAEEQDDSPFDCVAAPSKPRNRSPYRRLPSGSHKEVNWNRYTVDADEMPSTADVEAALWALDNSTHEEKEKAFARGGVFTGPKGSKRFIPTGDFMDDEARRASNATKASPFTGTELQIIRSFDPKLIADYAA
jgi:hypothetical protein